MALTQNAKLAVAGGLVVFGLGLATGLLLNDIPFISFKKEVDLGTGIAILGLVATIFIMPFIVNRQLAKQDNINSVILIDIEAVHASVAKLRELYVGLKPSTKISRDKYVLILSSFKTISAEIDALSTELESKGRLKGFKKDVYDTAYIKAYETCTDVLKLDKKLDATTILEGSKSLNALCSELRKYRYETYA